MREVREYIQALGHKINERGRIPADLLALVPEVIPPRETWPSITQINAGTIEHEPEQHEKSADLVAAEAADRILDGEGEPDAETAAKTAVVDAATKAETASRSRRARPSAAKADADVKFKAAEPEAAANGTTPKVQTRAPRTAKAAAATAK